MFKPQRKIYIRWSSDFAYAIGLIASDGSLSKDKRHIEFKSADKELVRNFKKALGIHNRIGIISNTPSGRPHYYVFCGDVIFYTFLNSIGIRAHKSKTIQAVRVPPQFFGDFLRGLFDGDGTFYTFLDKRWPHAMGYHISFSSASARFIHWLKNQLSQKYSVKGFIKKGKGVLNLCYAKRDTHILFSVLYSRENILFLKRKRDKMVKVFRNDTYARMPS